MSSPRCTPGWTPIVKATPLKTLQGQIWAAGFAAGELAAHVFADVAPRLRAWHAAGVAIAVYSSGSVASQRAWFEHTNDGRSERADSSPTSTR